MSAELDWEEPAPRLVDLLLEEQRTLSAVDEFAAHHASVAHDGSRYEALLPAGPPAAGEQYAFRVDLDACTGCKACVTACHSLNGLDEGETWRRVGLVESAPTPPAAVAEPLIPAVAVHQQTVTTACHHCEDPGCLAGCPVQAYDKDPTTGIVHHLDDQCIGCRYCQLTCPYDVPSFSERLGIVRKCDMCRDRLAEGEAPACVQGCPNGAIAIDRVAVGDSEGARLLGVSEGAMPDSGLTRPTTRYVSTRPIATAVDPIDLATVAPAEGHTPLAVMLTLSQLAIGAVVLVAGLAWLPEGLATAVLGAPLALPIALTVATVLGLTGLGASLLHIGRPQWAFRVVLGLRTSWLSREIVVLGGFAGLLVAGLALSWIDAWGVGVVGIARPGEPWQSWGRLAPLALGATAATGLLGLLCSIQIYAVTGRPLWRFDRTLRRFAFTALAGGLAIILLGLAATPALIGEPIPPASRFAQVALCLGLLAATRWRLRLDAGPMLDSEDPVESIALARTRRLLDAALAVPWRLRRRLLVAAGLALPLAVIAAHGLGLGAAIVAPLALGTLATLVAAELFERSLFFRSEAMPGMPGAGGPSR